MKKNILKNISLAFVFIFVIAAFAGCGSSGENRNMDQPSITPKFTAEISPSTNLGADTDDESKSGVTKTELTVSFGDRGRSFTMIMISPVRLPAT